MRRRTQRSATPPEVPPARAGVRTLTSGAWPRGWGTGRGGRALEVHLPSLTAHSPRAEAAVPADLGDVAARASFPATRRAACPGASGTPGECWGRSTPAPPEEPWDATSGPCPHRCHPIRERVESVLAPTPKPPPFKLSTTWILRFSFFSYNLLGLPCFLVVYLFLL